MKTRRRYADLSTTAKDFVKSPCDITEYIGLYTKPLSWSAGRRTLERDLDEIVDDIERYTTPIISQTGDGASPQDSARRVQQNSKSAIMKVGIRGSTRYLLQSVSPFLLAY